MADGSNPGVETEIVIKFDDQFSREAAKAADSLEGVGKSADAAAKKAKTAGTIAVDAMQKVGDSAHKAAGKITDKFKGATAQIAGLIGVGLGISEIVSRVSATNMAMDDLTGKVQAAQLAFQQWNPALSTVDRIRIAGEEAGAIFQQLEKQSYRLALPATELANAYQYIALPAMKQLGLSQNQTFDLLKQSAELSKVFGASLNETSKLVSKALVMGTVEGETPLAMSLKSALGDMTKLTRAARLERVSKELAGYGQAADAMATSVGDVVFRAQESINNFLREAGGPTFRYITERIKEWSEKLNQVDATGRKLSDVYGGKILNGFKTLESVVSTLLSYWKEIGYIIGGLKIGSMLGSGAAGVGGMLSAFTGPMAKLGTGFNTLSSKLPGVVGALGLFAAGLGMAATAIDKWQSKELAAANKVDETKGIIDKLYEREEKLAYKFAKGGGIANAQGELQNRAQLVRGFEGLDRMDRALQARRLGLAMNSSSEAIVAALEDRLKGLGGRYMFKPKPAEEKALPVQEVHPKGLVKQQITNQFGDVHIKQDFKDVDPDRVFIRFKKGLEGLAENRVQSNLSEPLGE